MYGQHIPGTVYEQTTTTVTESIDPYGGAYTGYSVCQPAATFVNGATIMPGSTTYVAGVPSTTIIGGGLGGHVVGGFDGLSGGYGGSVTETTYTSSTTSHGYYWSE